MRACSTISVDDLLSVCGDAYSLRTFRGYGSDLSIFITRRADQPCAWLPADPKRIARYVDDQVERGVAYLPLSAVYALSHLRTS
jgi:hypothetical protein